VILGGRRALPRRGLRIWAGVFAAFVGSRATDLAGQAGSPEASQTATRPEIIRTAHGVPHIYAQNFWAAGYGLAWVELEDYGVRVVNALIAGRGEMGLIYGRDSVEQDFARRPIHAHARRVWRKLEPATRAMYAGFAAAANDYIRSRPDEFPSAIGPVFSGWDVLAREIAAPDVRGAKRLLSRAAAPVAGGTRGEGRGDGSNAWALAPSRTTSGRAMLLRNPHLNWDAGYYEAHLVVADSLDFYGDFRIGGAFAVVGGFNRHLGWATTNNALDDDELYAVPLARRRAGLPERIVLDGQTIPLTKTILPVSFRTDTGIGSLARESWSSPFGPVIDRRNGTAYILRTASEGEFRGGEQFLKMMRATSFGEWEAAMRIRARTTSNFTYADRAGNIFYVWNGALPALPHPPGGDSTIIRIRSRDEMFSRVVPWDSLPMIKNPPGGYLHNENDSPHFASLEASLDSTRYPLNVERPSLGFRSQHSLDLIRHPGLKLSLEEMIRLKHSPRMLLAERILPDLLAAAPDSGPAGQAAAVLREWDRTVAADSRGGVLFEAWWRRYRAELPRPFREEWSAAEPIATPRGLADPVRAAAALGAAADSLLRRFGRLDVAWGEAHRIRIGAKDLPAAGCPGDLGCFRVLWFREDGDRRRVVQGGDGWILAVEFGDSPRAYSVLGYGQSSRPDSPLFGDQAERFAAGDLKPVAFLREDVERGAVRRYRAGCATARCAGETRPGSRSRPDRPRPLDRGQRSPR
jgi:acyl-homoserine-lactone acylase